MESRHDVLPRTGDSLGLTSFGPTSPASTEQPRRRAQAEFPPLDEHLVVPEITRDEVVKGRKVVAMAGDPEHADAQAGLTFLLRAHVQPGRIVSTELLTRVSKGSDFATDVCIRKEGIDPTTGKRYLEEVSFEIVNEQRLSLITDKADELARRGVRRIFAIFVKKSTIGEWSKKQRKFVILNPKTLLEDPVFVRPIVFSSLIDGALTDQEVARALVAKNNPVIVELRQQSEAKGRKQGIDEGRKQGIDEGRKQGIDEGKLRERRETLVELLAEKFGPVAPRWKKRIDAADFEELRNLLRRLVSSNSISSVFAKR